MQAVLLKSFIFICIIILGIILKKIKIFDGSEVRVLAKIFLYLTLPALIISNFNGFAIDINLISLFLLGIFSNIALIWWANFSGSKIKRFKCDPKQRSFNIVNISSFNIGGFTMPFVYSFAGVSGVVSAGLFDAGNSIFACGLSFAIAYSIKYKNSQQLLQQKIKFFLYQLVASPPFMAYMFMIVISLLNFKLPSLITDVTTVIANANIFVVMLMIGVGLNLNIKRDQIYKIKFILFSRLIFAILFSVFIYFCLPFTQQIREILVMICFAPIGSSSLAFTVKLDEDYILASTLNSLSIILGIISIVILMLIFSM